MLCFPYSSDNKFDALIINKDKEEEVLGALNVYAQHYEAAVVRDNTQQCAAGFFFQVHLILYNIQYTVYSLLHL